MANRYWVGGTGTWNTSSTTNWSATSGGATGASVPTAADSIFFDQAGTYTVTLTGALTCLDITVSVGAVTFATGTTPTLAVSGSWSTIAGTVWNATGAITFNTAGSKTITTGGITINSPVTFNNATATWTLQDNLTFGNTLTTTLTAGTLALGSNTLTTGLFSSSNLNTRTINFGTGTIALVGSASATVWNTLSRSGLTILGTPNITSSGGGTAVTKTFSLGYAPQGSGTYNLSLLETTGTVTYAFTQNDTVNNLTINGLQTVTIPTATNIPALKVYGNYTYAATNGTTTFTGSTAGIVFAGDAETTVNTGGVSTAYPMVFNAGAGKPAVRLQGSLSGTRGNDTGGFVGFPYPAFNQSGSNTYTIEFWVNFNSTPTASLDLLRNGRLGANLAVQFSGSTATFRIFHAGFMQYGVNAVFDVPLQEWHHIAIIGNSTNTWIAVNGVVKAFGSLWGEGAYTANGSFPAGTFYSAAHSGDNTIIYNSFGGYGSVTYDYYISQFRISTGTSLIYNTTGFNPPALPLELTGVTGIACFVTNTSSFADLSASNGVLVVGSIRSTVATAPTREWIGSPPVAPTIRLLSNLNLGANAVHLINGNIDINSKTVTASSITISGGVSTIVNTGSSGYTPAMPITHSSGTLNLGTNLTVSSGGYALTSGTLSLGSSTLTTPSFASNNSNLRTIDFGTGKIVLNLAITGTMWNTATNTNLTISGTPLVECLGGGGTDSGPGQAAKNINTGAMTAANSISFSFLDTTDFVQYTFTDGSAFRNLIFNGAQRVGNNAITLYGSFTHQNTNGTTTFLANTNTWTFAATSGSHNITPVAGYAYDFPWTFNGIGGTWVLQNDLALGGLKTLTFVNGTLDSNNRTITGAAGITMITGTFALTGTAGTTLSTNAPITHTSGTLNLSTNLTTSSNTGYTLTAGTLALGTQTLTTTIFSSSNASTRTINFGTGKIVLTSSFNSTIWNTGTVTGLTVSGTPLVECRGGGVAAKTINTGALSQANAISFSLLETTGTVTYAFTASNVVRNLIVNGVQTISNIAITIFGEFTHATTNGTTTFTAGTNAWSFLATSGSYTITPVAGFTYDFPINIGTTGTTATYTLAANLAVGATRQLTLNNGTVDFNNKSIGGNITFSNANNITLLNTGSTTASWTASITHTAGSLTLPFNLTTTGTYTLTAGSLNLNGLTLTTGTFSSSNGNIRSVAFGSSNIILATTTAAQVNLAMAVTNNFTWTGTGGFVAAADITRTFEFASTTAGGNEPNLTFTGSGTAVQTITTNSRFNTLNFGTTAFALPTTGVNLRSLVLSTGGTFTGLSATMFRDGTITPNGKTIAALTINATLGTTNTITLAGSLACTTYTQTAGTLDFATFDLTCSGAATYTAGTLNNIGTITCTTWTCNNIFTLTQGTIAPSVSFVVAVGGFNYNGGTLSSVTNFTHTIGVVNLNSNLTLAATSTYTFTAGTLNLNNFTLATGIFSSNNANVRSVAFGTGNIVLSHTTAAQIVLALDNATNFNWTGTGGFVSDAVVTRTYTFGTTGGTFYNAPSLAITSGDQIPTLTSNSWFNRLDFTGSSCAPAASTVNVDTLTLSVNGTYTNLIPQFTRTQTWTSQFGKQLGGIGINRLFATLTLGSTQTFTATSTCSVVTGTLDLGGYDLTVGLFSSSGTAPRTVVFGNNNIVLNHSTAAQTVLAVANATNFSYTSTGGRFVSDVAVTRTFTFGTTGGNISNAPSLLINSGAAIPTITSGSWFDRLDFTGSACTPAATTLNIVSLILSTGGTFTGLSATMRSTGIIAPNGKTIAALVINHSVLGTTTLTGALICTTQTYVNGNVDFAGFNLTGTAATYNNVVFSNINVLACTTFTIAGNFELITGTITPSTSIVLSSGSLTYTGGTLSPVGTFTHTAGTVALNKSYSLTATGTYTLTAGTLNLNGYNLTTGIFSSTGTGTRSIAFGTGNIVLAHTTAAQTVLNMADVTNFTESGTGGFTSAMTVTRTFTFGTTGGTASNAPNLSITSGSAVSTFTDGSWFNVLNFTGSSNTPATTALVLGINVNTLTLATGGTYTSFVPVFTRTQTWTSQFSKQLGGIGVNGSGVTLTLDNTQTYTATSTFIQVAGTLNLGGVDLTIGRFASSNTNTRSIAFGTNNIVLAHTTAATTVLSIADATNFSYTGTGGFRAAADITRTFTFGTTGGSATSAPNLTLTGSGTAIPTLTTGSWFNKLDFGTTAFNPGTTALNLNSLTLSAGGTYTTLTPTMVGAGTIINNGKAIAALTINHTGTTTLADALSVAATATTTLTAGTLNVNGFTLTTGIFSSSNTNARVIAFGTGNIVLAHTTAATTVLAMADATNFSYTGTGGFTSAMGVTRTFTFGTTGGTATNAPNLSLTSGVSVPTITTNSWFKNLNFTGSASAPAASTVNVDTLTLDTGGTYTGLVPVFTRTQTWTSQFSKQLGGIGFNLVGGTLTLNSTQTYTATSQCILTAGTLDLGGSNQTFGSFSSSNTNARVIAFGANNITLATTTAAAVNLAIADATNFSYTGTGGFTAAADITRTFTFGTTGGTSTNAPRLTFTGSGTAIPTLTTGSWFDALNFGTTAFALAATTLNLDSLTLSTGGTFTSLTATMVGTGTITPNGKAIAALTVNHTGTTTLAGALATALTATTALTSGTLNLNNFTLTTGAFSSANTNTRSVQFGTGNIVLAHTTLATTVLSMATATGFTCSGTGGFTAAADITRTFSFGSAAGGASTNAPNLSLTSGAAVPTFASGSWFNTLNFTGTTSTPATTTVNVNSLILATGGTYTGLTANMVGNGTITSAGKTIAALNISSNSADVATLNDALTVTGTTTLSLGQLNLNNFTLTTSGLSSSNTNVRAIAFGSGSIALTGTAALAMADASNFTYTGTGGFTSAMSVARTFTFGTTGGTATNAPNLSLTSGASIPTFTTGSWFKALNFTGTTSTPAVTTVYVDTLTLATGGTYTGLTPIFTRTQTWTSQFSKVLDGIGFNLPGGTLTLNNTQTYSATGSCNLIAGTLDLGGANLTVGRFLSNNSNTRAIAFGANNIVLATTVANILNLDMVNATGFSWTGTGGFAAAANIIRQYTVGASTVPTGAAVYTTPGTYSWTAPAGVTSVSVVAVGGGGAGNNINLTGDGAGGSGGGLGWKNNIPVTPGQSYTVVVGAPGTATGTQSGQSSYFIQANSNSYCTGGGGGTSQQLGGAGGGFFGDGGGNGGIGYGPTGDNTSGSGAGGAGGYSGSGGNGKNGNSNPTVAAAANSGGAAGGGQNEGGGGVGIYGKGSTGGFGTNPGSGGGSGGGAGSGAGGAFGGGGYGSGSGGRGAVRIIWGTGREFPSTLVAAEYDVSGSGAGAATAANAPNLTLTGTGTAVQTFVSGSWFNNLNFGTTAFAVPEAAINVNTLTLSSAGTYTSLVPVFTRTQTWTPQFGKQLGGIGVNETGVTVTLDATQTYNPTTSKLIVDSGTINLAGNSVDFYDVESNRSGSRAITGAGTLNIYNNWTVYVGAGFSAAGCTINMASNNFYKTFAGGGGTYGTLVQKSAAPLTITGSNTFESIQVSDAMSPITPPAVIDFLMVAGGGGHQIGGDANAGHGGAGAGGLLYRTAYTIPTAVLTQGKTITVTVGAGGAAANGTNSSMTTADNTLSFTTIGGGRGGVFNGNGIAGGSGGGGGGRDYPPGDGGAAQQPASASGGNGFAGGRCRTLNDGSGTAAGGGGGGAGAVGANGVSRQGGVGGAGLAVPIIGTATAALVAVGQVVTTDVWFAGGGGGQANGTGGAGGAGGGAPGASSVFQGSGVIGNTQSNATGVRNGRSNTGGGAGGASTGFTGYGGTGGSGVVIIRHVRIAGYEAATVGCTIEYEGADILYIFKSSGTITF